MISNGNSFGLGGVLNSIATERPGKFLHVFDAGPESFFQRLGNAL